MYSIHPWLLSSDLTYCEWLARPNEMGQAMKEEMNPNILGYGYSNSYIQYLCLHFCFALLSDERLPDAEGNARLVHRLVRGYGHMYLVPHA